MMSSKKVHHFGKHTFFPVHKCAIKIKAVRHNLLICSLVWIRSSYLAYLRKHIRGFVVWLCYHVMLRHWRGDGWEQEGEVILPGQLLHSRNVGTQTNQQLKINWCKIIYFYRWGRRSCLTKNGRSTSFPRACLSYLKRKKKNKQKGGEREKERKRKERDK